MISPSSIYLEQIFTYDQRQQSHTHQQLDNPVPVCSEPESIQNVKVHQLIETSPELREKYAAFLGPVEHKVKLFQLEPNSTAIQSRRSHCQRIPVPERPLFEVAKFERDGLVVTLDCYLSFYYLPIKILNLPIDASPIADSKGSGSFGEVHIIHLLKKPDENSLQPRATVSFIGKRIPFCKNIRKKPFAQRCLQISEQLRLAVSEYCLCKIASQLRIGPRIDNKLGFDIVVYNDCVEFFMETCVTEYTKLPHFNFKTFSERLKVCVGVLHNNNVIHKDIKPLNVLYSPSLRDFVLSDFGISQSLAQGYGYKSKTYREGTPKYLGPELKALGSNEGYVDLYCNDVYSLQKTLEDVFNECMKRKMLKPQKNMLHFIWESYALEEKEEDVIDIKGWRTYQFIRALYQICQGRVQTIPNLQQFMPEEWTKLVPFFPELSRFVSSQNKCQDMRLFRYQTILRTFGDSEKMTRFIRREQTQQIKKMLGIDALRKNQDFEISLSTINDAKRLKRVLKNQRDLYEAAEKDEIQGIRHNLRQLLIKLFGLEIQNSYSQAECETYLNQLIELSEQKPVCQVSIFKTMLNLQKGDLSLDLIQQIDINQLTLNSVYQLSKLVPHGGEYKTSGKALLNKLLQKPELVNYDAYCETFITLIGKIQEFEESWIGWIQKYPLNSLLRDRYAYLICLDLTNKRRYKQAIDTYDSYKKSRESSKRYSKLIAFCYVELGRYEQARRVYAEEIQHSLVDLKCIGCRHNLQSSQFGLAMMYYHQGLYAKCLQWLLQIHKFEVEDIGKFDTYLYCYVNTYLACCYTKLNQLDQALRIVQDNLTLIAQSPNGLLMERLQVNLFIKAEICGLMGRLADLQFYCDQAIIHETKFSCLSLECRLRLSLSKLENSLDILKEAMQLYESHSGPFDVSAENCYFRIKLTYSHICLSRGHSVNPSESEWLEFKQILSYPLFTILELLDNCHQLASLCIALKSYQNLKECVEKQLFTRLEYKQCFLSYGEIETFQKIVYIWVGAYIQLGNIKELFKQIVFYSQKFLAAETGAQLKTLYSQIILYPISRIAALETLSQEWVGSIGILRQIVPLLKQVDYRGLKQFIWYLSQEFSLKKGFRKLPVCLSQRICELEKITGLGIRMNLEFFWDKYVLKFRRGLYHPALELEAIIFELQTHNEQSKVPLFAVFGVLRYTLLILGPTTYYGQKFRSAGGTKMFIRLQQFFRSDKDRIAYLKCWKAIHGQSTEWPKTALINYLVDDASGSAQIQRVPERNFQLMLRHTKWAKLLKKLYPQNQILQASIQLPFFLKGAEFTNTL